MSKEDLGSKINIDEYITPQDISNLENNQDEPELTEQEIQMAKKSAREIRVDPAALFEDVARKLIALWKKWINCFVEFNWKEYYSIDTKTMDDAYMQFCWKTKIGYEKDIEKERQSAEIERKKAHLEFLDKAPTLLEESKKYVKSEHLQEWEGLINWYINKEDEDGKYIEDIVTLMKMLGKWDSYKDIQKVFDEIRNYGEWYSIQVRRCVIKYWKKGKEFEDNIN